MWGGHFNQIIESLNRLIEDETFTGETANAIKYYLQNHVLAMKSIEAIIAEYNSKIALYTDGLYQYDSDYHAIINEDYLTLLIGKIGNMVSYRNSCS